MAKFIEISQVEFSSKFADKVVRLRHGKLDRIELLDQSTMKHNLGSQDKISDCYLSQSASQSSSAENLKAKNGDKNSSTNEKNSASQNLDGEDQSAENSNGENQGAKNSGAQNSGA